MGIWLVRHLGHKNPLTVDQFRELSPEDAKRIISESYEKTQDAQNTLVDILPQAIFALNKYPQLLVQNRNLLDRINGDKNSEPPPPSGVVQSAPSVEEDKVLTSADYNAMIMGG